MTFKEKYNLPPEEWGRFDTRAFIKKRIAEEGVTIKEVAEKIGLMRANLGNGLNGRITIPMDKLETLLWLFGPSL